ncbi:hypothetical protein J31TS4_01980 [Paenibacillus sp. J31TS4]|uniref:LamG-like jellyroll fold domain-containing protein n=1 Tax=Paenibacillus sp. J31TS4 TaxID=2807195 RepID=UPI001B25A320|nr:LamG-like jellyroll fold domain-containing protein [Paenibacillus sp. J31TS4]GIP36918.1 hypothetical protein J31TS4_01980 [Paenibacillus sp. J31TS4]
MEAGGLKEQILRSRKQKGLTQERLAERLGVTYQAVSKWENGQSMPDVTLLPLLADTLGMTMDELFGIRREESMLRDGLLAEYLFEGDARDTSGNGYTARVVGARLCPDRFGRADSAYAFNGRDEYLVMDPAPLLGDDGFSLSVWCRYESGTPEQGWHSAIVSQDGHHKRRVFQLSTYDRSVVFHRFLTEPDLVAADPIEPGVWCHYAVSYEKGSFRFYRNGQFVHEVPGTLRPNAEEPLYIGRKATDEPYFFFRGSIDDLRLYGRALSEAEISSLFRENGWVPAREPRKERAEETVLPVLDRLEHIRIGVGKEALPEAVAWYVNTLGFHLHVEEPEQFYLLTLYNGPSLMLLGVSEEDADVHRSAPFVYKTKRPVSELRLLLETAGARQLSVHEEAFATFVCFRDPFGYAWMLERDRRG